MSLLEESLRELEGLIKRDILILDTRLKEIGEHQELNFRVTKRNYLEPWTRGGVLAMNHEDGKFMYYQELRQELIYILFTGFIPEKVRSMLLPGYLIDFENIFQDTFHKTL